MKLSAYFSPSRHGVYYFRPPLPQAENDRRRTVRVSLRTKCPDRAGDLARYLASCGRLVRDNKTLARLRQDLMRDMVRSYFVAFLERYTEQLNDTGLSEQSLRSPRTLKRAAAPQIIARRMKIDLGEALSGMRTPIRFSEMDLNLGTSVPKLGARSKEILGE